MVDGDVLCLAETPKQNITLERLYVPAVIELIADAKEFCERAKSLDLLLVPSDSFGCSGFVRISYCVDTNMIRRSLPLFKKLIESL